MKGAFLAFTFVLLFGYTFKVGKCVTHDQRLKTQREAVERTARQLVELEQKIKDRQTPNRHHSKNHAPRVGTKNEKEDEEV